MNGPGTLDVRGAVRTAGKIDRTSAAAAIKCSGASGILLSVGHGLLPCVNGTASIADSFPRSAGSPPIEPNTALALQPAEGSGSLSLALCQGYLDARLDCAVSSMDGVDPRLDTVHPAIGSSPPFAMRAPAIGPGDSLFQWSRTRQTLVGGEAADPAMVRSVSLTLPGGAANRYEDLIAVVSLGSDFAAPGDSGSLVVDALRRVVGLLIGTSADHLTAYVLPVARLQGRLTDFDSFFSSAV